MKQQTFIAYFLDESENIITFERFACKRISTVIKHINQLWQSDLYRTCTKGAVNAEIYATPDGYNRELKPCYEITLAI